MIKILYMLITVMLINLTCATSTNAANEVAAQVHKQDPYEKIVTEVSSKLMQQYNIPGVAITIINDDQTYTYVYGSMNQATGQPVTEDTIFEIGSITKLFVALLGAEAENNGIVKLSDPLKKYCPEFGDDKSPSSQITLTHLFTHTAGFSLNLPEQINTKVKPAEYLSVWQPEQPIGSEWRYSNVGIGLAALALENQYHKSIDQLIKEKILLPLKMTPLGLKSVERYSDNYAQGYSAEGKAAPHVHYKQDPFSCAYSLKATINEMSKFLAATIGTANTPKNIRNAMHNAQTPRADIGSMQMGLGWQVHSLDDDNLKNEPENFNLGPLPVRWLPAEQQIYKTDVLLDKTGGTGGFRSYIAVIPEKKVGVVILLNKYIPNGAVVTAGRNILGIGE